MLTVGSWQSHGAADIAGTHVTDCGAGGDFQWAENLPRIKDLPKVGWHGFVVDLATQV
jgi:hypothetical protein